MKLSIFFVLSLIINECKSQNDSSLFRLGIHIDSVKNCNDVEKMSMIMGISGPIKDGIRCKIQGVTFDIAFSEEGKVIFYGTRDPDFTVNNFKYLNRSRKIIDSLKGEKIMFNWHTGFYIELPQGWKLGFYIQDMIEKNGKWVLKKNAKPNYIFKEDLSNYTMEKKPAFGGRKPIEGSLKKDD